MTEDHWEAYWEFRVMHLTKSNVSPDIIGRSSLTELLREIAEPPVPEEELGGGA